jgi:hypothetical protein
MKGFGDNRFNSGKSMDTGKINSVDKFPMFTGVMERVIPTLTGGGAGSASAPGIFFR